MIEQILWTALVMVVAPAVFAVFAAVIHGIWLAGEWIKARLADRLGVPYVQQRAPWITWLHR